MVVSGLTVRLPLAAAVVTLFACDAGSAAVSPELTSAALRPDSPNTDELPPVFSSDEKVETFDSAGGQFRVHFTRTGENAVPLTDADGDKTPDYVQLVAAEYDKVGDFYANELGFERPPSDQMVPEDNGGDGRFDVYLVDFSTTSDGSYRGECPSAAATSCPGYMKQENDFVGHDYPSLSLATRILASHEYFHAVQAGYDSHAGSNIDEGTAVWGSEQYDPTLDDLEGFVAGYLQRPDRSLSQEPSGPVDAFSYGLGVFFQFLGERYGRETIRELWEQLRDDVASDGADATWPPALDTILKAKHDASLADAFSDFQRWNLYTAGRADPTQAYESGAMYPEITAKVVTLPFEDAEPRIFPLAAKWYSVRARNAGEVQLALKTDGSLGGVRLLLARVANGKVAAASVTTLDDKSKKASFGIDDVDSGDTVFAAVLNTRLEGESSRPSVYLGNPKDVEAYLGMGGSSDAGARDDAGESDDDSDKSKDDGGCSVSTPGARGAGSAGALLLAAAASIISRQWRRHRAGSRSRARRSVSSETWCSPACPPCRNTLRS